LEASIGIDLGTTNSLVATMVDGRPRIIERREGQRLLASMVGYTPDGERVVGEAARRLSVTHPTHVAFATKRFMGQRWTPELAARYRTLFPFPLVSGPTEDVRVKLAERALPIAQIAAALLSELRQDASDFLGVDVTRAVITVPANFNDAQRQATKEAAQIAGLEVLRLLNEPTAAALAYGLHTSYQGSVLVFDLGGGTLDVSLLELKDGVFEVVATGGDPFLGGEDFDEAIANWLLSQLPWGVGHRVLQDRAALAQVRAVAERLKCTLSSATEAPVATTITCGGAEAPLSLEAKLTEETFEALVSDKAERCLQVVERTLKDAGRDPRAVGQIILVGGMTRLPLIRRRVAERFGVIPSTHLFPEEVVALGAAIYASELVGKKGRTVLLDVVSSTLGVGVVGGVYRPLIAKNRSLPCRVREVFYPARHEQSVVRVRVAQGESGRLAENHLLGEVVLEGLAGSRRSEKAIEVVFDLDLDGSLAVSACEVATGRTSTVKVRARTDLQPRELERLAREEAERHAASAPGPEERKRNAQVRTEFRRKLVALRKMHTELVLAAQEAGGGEARVVVDALGQRLVEAERLEQTGTVAEVQGAARKLEDLIFALNGTGPASDVPASPDRTAGS
jgi:molecular chaperone DnaK